jgi:hypothetical protein
MEDEEKKKRKKSRSSVFNLPATALRKEMQGYESLPPAELGTDLLSSSPFFLMQSVRFILCRQLVLKVRESSALLETL